jgi:hypothetical protein
MGVLLQKGYRALIQAGSLSWVEKVTKPIEIFVVMEGGVVHEIVDLPDHIHVTVIDYDTEGVEKERLEISPVDGEVCVINKW